MKLKSKRIEFLIYFAMAPKIKLTYFDVRARAELSRMILAQAGAEYEDCRGAIL